MIDAYAVFKAVERVTMTTGLKLKMSKDPQPYTDLVSGTVYVPEINSYWSEHRLNLWLGYVYHEIGHHAPEVIDTLSLMQDKDIKSASKKGRLLNILDDYRQEKNKLGHWPGRDEALSWTQAYHCAEGAHTIKVKGLDSDMELVVNVFAWVYTCRGEWQPDVAFPAMEFCAVAPDPDKYSHLTDELNAAVTAEDVYNIVIKILDEDNEEEEENENKEEGEGEAGDEEGEGKSKGTGEGGGGEDKSEESDKGSVSYKDLMFHVSEGESDKLDKKGYKIVYDHVPVKDFTPWTKMFVGRNPASIKTEVVNVITKLYDDGSKLSGQVFRLFQSRTQTQVVHNKKAGRLNKRDLYRIPTGALDVFSGKTSKVDIKGTCIHVMVDMSGSMAYSKFEAAGAAVCLLNEALTPLGIPVKITGFTEMHSKGCIHYILKDWQDRPTPKKFIEEYSKSANSLVQNSDGESILWGYSQLMARPEQRKILIVLSDGLPCCDNPGDAFTFTKDVIREVSKRVECYGIGILDDAVEKLYPQYSVLYSLDELESCLFNVIKTKLF